MNSGHGRVDLLAAYDVLTASGGCTDGDADGAYAESNCGTVVDCDDADGNVWATPGEVRTVTFGADGATLAWVEPLEPGASPGWVRYDVLRSPDASDFLTAPTCVESDDASDTEAFDPAVPGIAECWFYLLRAENACPGGQGPLGNASTGSVRTGGDCP
jgi:hypothetical protein